MEKPLWFEINKKEFEELTGDIYNNQHKNNFKIIINKRTYDLKNAKKFRMEVTTRKTTKSEAKELYNELIQWDIDALEGEEINDTRKYNIFNILNNVGSIFADTYLYYKNVPKETMFERRIAQIKRKEQNVNNELKKAQVVCTKKWARQKTQK